MGEAKRRAAASPYAKTTAGQMLRKLNAMAAALPPRPMNGATSLDLSPADYQRILAQTETKVGCFDGASLFGLAVRSSVLLSDGSIIGRRGGKAVWSNHPLLQEMIDEGMVADA